MHWVEKLKYQQANIRPNIIETADECIKYIKINKNDTMTKQVTATGLEPTTT